MSWAEDEGLDCWDEDDFLGPDLEVLLSLPSNQHLHITKYWEGNSPFTWKTRGSLEMTIEQMDDGHLVNALKLAFKKGQKSYQYLCQEAAFRGLKVF